LRELLTVYLTWLVLLVTTVVVKIIRICHLPISYLILLLAIVLIIDGIGIIVVIVVFGALVVRLDVEAGAVVPVHD